MSSLDITRVTIAGFSAIRAHSGPLALIILPDLGGKVCSLRDTRNNREWLWRHPRLPYRRVAPDADYGAQADTGGWDECFPSVAACRLENGRQIPDHGELWSQTPMMEVLPRGDAMSFRCRWRGKSLPYAFERTLTIVDGSATLRCDYSVSNLSDEPLPFIWCAHPLLAIEPGMRLQLPAAARFNRWGSLPADLLAGNVDLPFPPPYAAAGVALDPLPPPTGTAMKLWSDPLPPDSGIATVQADNGSLTMRWDTALLPQLAIWLNLGAWAGDGGPPLYNLGLEPCIGAQDSLATAIADERAAQLAPRASRRWWLEVGLESA